MGNTVHPTSHNVYCINVHTAAKQDYSIVSIPSLALSLIVHEKQVNFITSEGCRVPVISTLPATDSSRGTCNKKIMQLRVSLSVQ